MARSLPVRSSLMIFFRLLSSPRWGLLVLDGVERVLLRDGALMEGGFLDEPRDDTAVTDTSPDVFERDFSMFGTG